MELHQYERMLLSLLSSPQGKAGLPLDEAAGACGLNRDAAFKAASWLAQKGLAHITSTSSRGFELTEEGKRYSREGSPEYSLLKKACKEKAGLFLSSLPELEKKIGLQWAKKKGWIEISSGKVFPAKEGLDAAAGKDALSEALGKIAEGKAPAKNSEEELLSRKLALIHEKRSFFMELTEEGKKMGKSLGPVSAGQEINQLTREMLLSGSWKGRRLREYETGMPVEETIAGKRHIISALSRKISGIFTEMGFQEMHGNMIESSFWNFDALFQPQDHPARDLADTFYLEGDFPLPDSRLVSKVKSAHEKGWKYKWEESEAKKGVLRTHTTAVSARTLHSNGGKPGKYFCIGKVFRNEATDYKHLAEFYQVEGIVSWEGANFRHLLGFLSEFYRKLGFEKIRFRPSYFPYTEPSLEVHVWYEPKKAWMELGGAGIFRPEVSMPLCGKYPVLAWGLSLERPLMMMLEIEDIRSFYRNRVSFLRSAKIHSI